MGRQRYEILDGLRGVAALMVVIFHLSEAFSYDPVYKHLNHGYLCVDFFFVLSGFVIAYAYGDRMRSGVMSRWDFIKARIIRLQPMVLLGVLLGAALFFFQECDYYKGIADADIPYLLRNMLSGFLMIPITPDANVRANEEMFLLNIPQWSMVFEYLANIIFCIFVFKLGRKGLVAVVAIFALMLADSALSLNILSTLQPHDYPCSLNAGWSFTPEQFYIGTARVGYSFFMGMLLFELLEKSRPDNGTAKASGLGKFTVCSIIIIGIVCTEQIGGYEHPLYDGLFNLVAVGIICPLTVCYGSRGCVITGRTRKVCDFLGRLSYPLYLVHYPLVYLFFTWMDTHHDASVSLLAFTSSSIFLLSVALAYAAMRLWDEPVREWLTEKIGKKKV